MKNTLEFFSKLTNAKLDVNTVISLSSAQKSRAYAWLEINKIPFQYQLINKKFTLATLLVISNEKVIQDSSNNEEITSNIIPSPITNQFGQVGIDIQRIDELFPEGIPKDLKSADELKLIFTNRELTYAEGKNNPEETLTGIFAAKESILKTGLTKKALTEIEILPNSQGQPKFDGTSISISHSGNYAVAMAIPTHLISTSNIKIQGIEDEKQLELKPQADKYFIGRIAHISPLNSIKFWILLSLVLALALLFKIIT